MKLSGYKMGIKFDKKPLAVEQNNYATKIVNALIVYDLNAWPKNPLNNFKFNNCLFGATNMLKNSVKQKWVYSGYGIAFDGGVLWNFGNDLARNIVIFGAEISWLFHADNLKNKFLVLGEGSTYGVNGRFGSPEKKFSVNFTKANTKFGLNLNYNGDNIYLFVIYLFVCF